MRPDDPVARPAPEPGPPQIPIITSVAPLAERYDAWFCDVWGVVHNGAWAFEAAADACRRFREAGGTVVLISNSPRPAPAVSEQMRELGVPDGVCDHVVTSGDVTRGLLAESAGRRVFHLGPARDQALFAGLDVAFADEGEADLVLCSGLYDDDTETPDDYADMLARLHARALPMICANPDLMVERGERLIYCAGTLAAAYEALGGAVTYTGKPHLPLYRMACGKLGTPPPPRERILAIGDGIRTDIAGAAAAGLDALFVASGLHVAGRASGRTLDQADVAALFADGGATPIAAIDRLAW